ncbi:uncharacterized protein N7458_003745 [Penicillium daleae]|uniref:Uncharacterized protein n=1 Tax=Penicillium daleae TaxID=63821 RepID=A0AAD6CAG5_9EURO|nr:uncharacterized protein N7458_003745 [Penicillium daleae]KAJ5456162.1 hypothetical protein N7458_003745 [Penicillium daleae]
MSSDEIPMDVFLLPVRGNFRGKSVLLNGSHHPGASPLFRPSEFDDLNRPLCRSRASSARPSYPGLRSRISVSSAQDMSVGRDPSRDSAAAFTVVVEQTCQLNDGSPSTYPSTNRGLDTVVRIVRDGADISTEGIQPAASASGRPQNLPFTCNSAQAISRADIILMALATHRPGVSFEVLFFQPRVLAEGTAVKNLTAPDLALIGSAPTSQRTPSGPDFGQLYAAWPPIAHHRDQCMRDRFSRKIIDRFEGNLVGRKLAMLGFAFKKNTGDTRESWRWKSFEDILRELETVCPSSAQIRLSRFIRTRTWPVPKPAVLVATDCDQFRNAPARKIIQSIIPPMQKELARSTADAMGEENPRSLCPTGPGGPGPMRACLINCDPKKPALQTAVIAVQLRPGQRPPRRPSGRIAYNMVEPKWEDGRGILDAVELSGSALVWTWWADEPRNWWHSIMTFLCF